MLKIKNSDTELPVVAHAMRRYLSPTETFIGYQISLLETYQPIVLCREQSGTNGGKQAVFSSLRSLKGMDRLRSQLFYRFLRCLSQTEVRFFLQTILREKTILLHFHYAVDARYFLEFKRASGLPAIVSCYGYDVSSFPRLYFGYGKKYIAPIFREMDLFLAMSEDMQHDLLDLGCPAEKIIVHYYGIEAGRFLFPQRRYNERQTPNILMCGTLEIKKAQHVVLAALRQLELGAGLKNSFRVTIIGEGPMKTHLENMVKSFGWHDRVRFAGYLSYAGIELAREYHGADIFALPSITVKGDKEGIPGTIVEAMAAGLPIVSTYHAGIPSVVKDHEEGLLVREGDINGLATALKELIEDPGLREKLGRKGAAKAAGSLSARNKIGDLEKVYADLIRRSRKEKHS